MKKRIVSVMLILLILTMAACSEKEPAETIGNIGGGSIIQDTTKPADKSEVATNQTEAPFDIDNWGQSDIFSTDDGVNVDRYQISVPNFWGSSHRNAIISEQLDGTVAFVSGQTMYMHAVENVSDIFASYMEYTTAALEDLYGLSSSNFAISIDSSEAVTIGDYEMYTHKGTITYDYDGTQRTHQYVAYTTKLKDSGNCAYWMVYDFTEDQSKGDLVAEHAYHMALTFREEE